MTRYGAQFGPDLTFLGVPAVDLADPAGLARADVVVTRPLWPFEVSTRRALSRCSSRRCAIWVPTRTPPHQRPGRRRSAARMPRSSPGTLTPAVPSRHRPQRGGITVSWASPSRTCSSLRLLPTRRHRRLRCRGCRGPRHPVDRHVRPSTLPGEYTEGRRALQPAPGDVGVDW